MGGLLTPSSWLFHPTEFCQVKSFSCEHRTSKGFSLIELLLVLGILAILVITAFVVYPQVRERNFANGEVVNLLSTKANINSMYVLTGGNYTGLSTAVANQARVFPASMNGNQYTPSAAIKSSWNGQVAVNALAAAGAFASGSAYEVGHAFDIQYADVPSGVCLPLVSGVAQKFQDIQIGTADPANSVFSGGAFNPGLAAQKCSNTAGSVVHFISN